MGAILISAQEVTNSKALDSQFKIHEKGKFFFTWGHNRSWYEKSDIHFTGQGHNFLLMMWRQPIVRAS